MEEIGAFKARTHFADLLRRVENGEEFLVTLRGRPVASLTAAEQGQGTRDIEELLDRLRKRREAMSKDGPVLKPRETWKDLARDGLKW